MGRNTQSRVSAVDIQRSLPASLSLLGEKSLQFERELLLCLFRKGATKFGCKESGGGGGGGKRGLNIVRSASVNSRRRESWCVSEIFFSRWRARTERGRSSVCFSKRTRKAFTRWVRCALSAFLFFVVSSTSFSFSQMHSEKISSLMSCLNSDIVLFMSFSTMF